MSTTIVEVRELISTNKAKAAFLAPLILAVAAAFGSWVVTGNWDDTEIRLAVQGAALGLASAVATYLAPAGTARVGATASGGVDARRGIQSERGATVVELAFALLLVLVAVGLLVYLT